MQNGGVTVWFSLVLVSLCSLFFSMVETVRIMEMKMQSKTVTQEALASAFSEYQPYLWEQYGILGLDANYGLPETDVNLLEERIREFCWNNCGSSFFQMNHSNCQIGDYSLLTDGNGYFFIKQAAEAAKGQMTQQLLAEWKEKTGLPEEGKEIDLDQQVENAESAMSKTGDQKSGDATKEMETTVTEQIDVNTIENPLTVFHQIKENGWIGLVTQGKEISAKTMDVSRLVSSRNLEKGNVLLTENIGVDDRVLYAWYLTQHFGLFGEEKEDRPLAYEMEYIVSGKNSDKENLESVIGKILAIREAENAITIMSNPSMFQETYNVAASIAGTSMNPAAITLVQIAVVGVWAFVESILDIRTLLQGEKVPVIKTKKDWTSSLYTLGSCLASSIEAKAAERGISYKQYLAAFIVTMSQEKIGLRPMDLIEEQLHQQEDYVNTRMDHMICAVEVLCEYQATPLFAGYIDVGNIKMDWYQCQTKESIRYL